VNEGKHHDVWRWLAAFLAGVVLAGMPAAFVSLTAPGRADYDALRRELVASQVQLARIEERLIAQAIASDATFATLSDELDALRAAIERKPN